MNPPRAFGPQPRRIPDPPRPPRLFVAHLWGAIGVVVGTAVSAGSLKLLCKVFCE